MIPLSNRPKVSNEDITNGYVLRYFVRNTSSGVITEIDKKQYEAFRGNPQYKTLVLTWEIAGFANNWQGSDGKTLYGTRHKNLATIDFYDRQLPGLKRILRNPLEYFFGIMNTSTKITQKTLPVSNIEIIVPPTPEPVAPVATAIAVSTSSLTFAYIIDGTLPTSQSVDITANGTLSDVYIQSGSSWVSASLSSSVVPTTLSIIPAVTGLYSGSYTSTVTVNTTQIGVTTASISVTLNVTNNPDILFIYEPGMPLDTATFTRATSASFNELVP